MMTTEWMWSTYLRKYIALYSPEWVDHCQREYDALHPHEADLQQHLRLQAGAAKQGMTLQQLARREALDAKQAAGARQFYAAVHDAGGRFAETPDGNLVIPETKRATPLEIKARKLDDRLVQLTGYASRWGGPPDSYNDIVERGAFAKTIAAKASKTAKVPLLAGHDPQKPIGGVLDLAEDASGLFMRGIIDLSTQVGHDTFSGIRNGYNTGLSIGYRTRDSWSDSKGVRHLTDIDLLEISVTPLPALDRAGVTRISLED